MDHALAKFLRPCRKRRMPAVLGAACLLFSACGPMKAYEGEARPAEEIAVLQWSNWTGGVRVKSLNGELPGQASSAQILPGENIVNFIHSPNFGLTTYSMTLTFDAEAGRRYKIDADCDGTVTCKPFWAWIEDAGDGSLVAGRRPE